MDSEVNQRLCTIFISTSKILIFFLTFLSLKMVLLCFYFYKHSYQLTVEITPDVSNSL